MSTPHIIARCPKCRRPLLPNGLCQHCSDPAEFVERLRESSKIARRRRRGIQGGHWLKEQMHVAAAPAVRSESELPPSDRE